MMGDSAGANLALMAAAAVTNPVLIQRLAASLPTHVEQQELLAWQCVLCLATSPSLVMYLLSRCEKVAPSLILILLPLRSL